MLYNTFMIPAKIYLDIDAYYSQMTLIWQITVMNFSNMQLVDLMVPSFILGNNDYIA